MTELDLAPDVLVVGGGIAGIVAAARARERGARVVLVRKGGGGSALSSGAIDIADDLVDAVPGTALEPFERGPRARRALDALAARRPRHPYARLGAGGRERLREAVALLKDLARPLDLIDRDDGHNHVLPTQLGTVRRAALVQRTQLCDLAALDEGTVVGIVQVSDLAGFDARPVVHTLAWIAGLGMRALQFLPIIVPRTRGDDIHHMPIELAVRLEDPSSRQVIVDALRGALRDAGRVPGVLLFPPALGLERAPDVVADLERATGKVVRELLATHPSVPGERLSRALVARLRARGVNVVEGAAVSAVVGARRVQRISIEGARVTAELAPRSLVLAGGRFLGGGIVRGQQAREPLLGLPVVVGGVALAERFVGDLLAPGPAGEHSLFRAGIAVDDRLRPVTEGGTVLLDNVVCAGSIIEGWDPARDGAAGAVSALTGLIGGEQAAAIAKGA